MCAAHTHTHTHTPSILFDVCVHHTTTYMHVQPHSPRLRIDGSLNLPVCAHVCCPQRLWFIEPPATSCGCGRLANIASTTASEPLEPLDNHLGLANSPRQSPTNRPHRFRGWHVPGAGWLCEPVCVCACARVRAHAHNGEVCCAATLGARQRRMAVGRHDWQHNCARHHAAPRL